MSAYKSSINLMKILETLDALNGHHFKSLTFFMGLFLI